MKTYIFAAILLGAVGTFSATDQASIEMDPWCITYLSTYLAPVSNQASALPSTNREAEEPIAQESGTLPFVPSIRPTFGRNTSMPMTRSTLSDDGQGALTLDTTFVSLRPTGTSPVSLTSAETSDLSVEPTRVLTNELATFSTLIQDLGSTASTVTLPTSSSINQPTGRSIILLVSISDNERRDLHRRATGGFVGIDNPDVCTFAAVFHLVEGELFDGGMPVYYSGEDFKDLAGQDIPSGDSITTTFTMSREYLVFRNSGLPNGDAGFCQVSDGQVYITFTAGPPGCVPVNLAVYDVDQCQDGRLIGGASLSSISSETVTSETVVPKSISSESVTNIEGTSAVEENQPIKSKSEGLSMPASTIQSESSDPVSQKPTSVDPTLQTSGSTDPDSQTSESRTSIMASSGGTDLTGKISSFITTIPTTETPTAQSSIALSTSDDSSTEEASSSTEIDHSTSLASTSTDLTGTFTIPSVETTILSTLDITSETTSSIEMSATNTNTARGPETTTTEVTTNADTTINTDTTTAKDQSTTENPRATTTAEDPTTTTDTTTAALSTTTSIDPVPPFVEATCNEVSSPYDDPIGVSFEVLCDHATYGFDRIDALQGDVFTECVRYCALNDRCAVMYFDRPASLCLLYSDFGGSFPDPQFDGAIRISGDGNRVTADDLTITENPATTVDTTTAAVSTNTNADLTD